MFYYNLLWLDDDVRGLQADQKALNKAPFRLTIADQRHDATQELMRTSIEIAVVDLKLDDEEQASGVDFCRDARQVFGYEDIYILIFTGFLKLFRPKQIQSCQALNVLERNEKTIEDLINSLHYIRKSLYPRRPRAHFLPGLEKAMRIDGEALLKDLRSDRKLTCSRIIGQINAFSKSLLPYIQGNAKAPASDPRRPCSASQQIVWLCREAEELLSSNDIEGKERIGSVAAYWELQSDCAYRNCLRYNWWSQ